MAVHPVDLVVGGHEGGDALLHTGLYRGQVDLPQLPPADPGGAGVDPAGGLPLGAQMLGHHVHPRPLDAPDRRTGHLGGQIGVLPEALLAPAPPGVPEHVQHGHQGQVHAHVPELLSADLGGCLQQRRVEGAGRRQVHRQQAAVQGLVAVGALGGEQHRDAQPGVLQHIPLDIVPGPDRQGAVQAGVEVLPGPGVRPVEAVEGPQTAVAGHLVLKLLGKGDILPLPAVDAEPVEPLGELPHLLPQRHAAQQVLRPLLRGQGGVFVCFHLFLSSIG